MWVGNHHQLLLSEPLTHLERSFRSRDELIDYVLPDEVLSREIAYLATECIQGRPAPARLLTSMLWPSWSTNDFVENVFAKGAGQKLPSSNCMLPLPLSTRKS